MATVTDANGNYTLQLVPGSYTLQFDHADYESASSTIDVKANQTTTVNIVLKRKKGSVSGTVTDEETTSAIANVTVTPTKI